MALAEEANQLAAFSTNLRGRRGLRREIESLLASKSRGEREHFLQASALDVAAEPLA